MKDGFFEYFWWPQQKMPVCSPRTSLSFTLETALSAKSVLFRREVSQSIARGLITRRASLLELCDQKRYSL